MDISNGEGIGVALFVQGCPFHCKNCFNPETWDFSGGKEWTDGIRRGFINLADKPWVKRISVLGGEPLADGNVLGVLRLINYIRDRFGAAKKVWIYTGYTWETIMHDEKESCVGNNIASLFRRDIVENCDVLVDGQYEDELRDSNLKWRGSSNQRVIDVPKTLSFKRVVLYKESDKHR